MKTDDVKRMRTISLGLLSGASVLSLALAAPVVAQDTSTDDEGADTIVVKGIRASLENSANVKRDAQGVIDAITAEDIGKFPDTNLAESLQRITGVSIDRSLGEGSTVTVRGFGPDFNLVLFNGRQMPTAYLEGGAPASRSYDFANIASEGIAAVEVYKSGRADLPTGGIGSTLNIRTARPLDAPGLKFSAGVKAVYDDSVTVLGEERLTPELSGIFSNTFMDEKFGIALAGSYQEREGGVAQFGTTSGWRGAYTGDQNNWGTLPQPPADTQVTNRPGPTDIYSVPQNGNYQLTNFVRERVNGQLTMQYRPVESVTATLDYFYSQNSIDIQRSDLSVWFNHGDTTSAWGDGPIADILFYNENFANTDLSMGAAQIATVGENESLAFNVEWFPTDRLSVELDVHSSSAESRPDSPYGSEAVVSTADFSLNYQGLDFRSDLPLLTIGFQDGTDEIDASRMLGTGSTFQASTIRTEIDQIQLFATYDLDLSFIQSVDFGLAQTTNTYRATFSNNQRDSWGGVGTAADYPDDIWTRANLSGNFDQLAGASATYPEFFIVDFAQLVSVMDQPIGGFDALCGGDGICTADSLANDQRTEEETMSVFGQVNTQFDVGSMLAELNAGVRYEKTEVTSEALVSFPTGTQWVAANEFGFLGLDDPNNRDFTQLTGEYDYWLPNVDFLIEPAEDVLLRASYSRTLTRPTYNNISGGQVLTNTFRIDGGSGSSGNPDLDPFLSWNLDLSAEWYYGERGGSYLSVGLFDKQVENFISDTVFVDTPFDVYTPIGGARYDAAVAALGTTDSEAIRQWIFLNTDPAGFEITGTNMDGSLRGNIFGIAGEDPVLEFDITRPINLDDKSTYGWEFNWQHILGDTGFGWIVNYTDVEGDLVFDNLQPGSNFGGALQNPLPGLSDTFNLIGFYDDNGLQVRLAYNWRDKFLTSDIGVSGEPGNPLYVEPYGQWDLNASYEVTPQTMVFLEAINITDEGRFVVGRSSAYTNFATQTGARYNFGLRYTF